MKIKVLLFAFSILVIVATQPALASSMSLSGNGPIQTDVQDLVYTLIIPKVSPENWAINLTKSPTSSGLFQQTTTLVLPLNFSLDKNSVPAVAETDLLTVLLVLFGPSYHIELNQSGPLKFIDATWVLKSSFNGSETTLFSMSADADLIAHGGTRDASDFLRLIGSFDMPITVTRNYLGDPYPEGYYRTIDVTGSQNEDLTFIATFSGTVVPLPGSIMLLAPGLLGLIGWKAARKKTERCGRG